ncbi:hypothetical protein FRB91_003337 [Serendipita sp. 411]|nr:hypothetical protein FRB91_003337 [Serendipita sp. 411]
MLAPSLLYSPNETFPVEPPSPIKQITAALHNLSINSEQPSPVSEFPLLILPKVDLPSSLTFPTTSKDLPNPLHILNNPPQVSFTLPTTRSTSLSDPDPSGHVNKIARDVSNSLEGTRYSFLVSSEPITAAQELPEMEKDTFSRRFVDSVLKMDTPPTKEEWKQIKDGISTLYNRHQRTLARCVMQELHCKRLRTTLATREMHKYHGTNAQRVLGTKEGRIMTGEAMLRAVAEDDRTRAEKEAKKQHSLDLKALHTEKKEWRDAEIAQRDAKYAEMITEWEAQCQSLPRGRRKPKKPIKPKRASTPTRFQPVSRRKAPDTRRRVDDSDDDEWCSEDNHTDDSE